MTSVVTPGPDGGLSGGSTLKLYYVAALAYEKPCLSLCQLPCAVDVRRLLERLELQTFIENLRKDY